MKQSPPMKGDKVYFGSELGMIVSVEEDILVISSAGMDVTWNMSTFLQEFTFSQDAWLKSEDSSESD